MPPRTVKEINEMLNQKYIFSGFNILIYAQNFVLKLAASTDTAEVNEENRDQLYKLYDYALQLEPKPEREELTYSQLQLVNKARSFVTLKMKRRQNMRAQKQDTKNMLKMKKLMGDQLKFQQLSVQKEIESELIQKMEKKEQKEQKQQTKEDSKEQSAEEQEEQEDVVIEIKNATKKKDKKRAQPEKQKKEISVEESKRVRFDLSQNKITEFFKHGKVAQRTFEL